MNRNIVPKCSISVEGLDKALEIAKSLIKADYQVFIQDDGYNVYIVSYAYNNEEYGADRFMLVSAEEEEYLENCRANKVDLNAPDAIVPCDKSDYKDGSNNEDEDVPDDEWERWDDDVDDENWGMWKSKPLV